MPFLFSKTMAQRARGVFEELSTSISRGGASEDNSVRQVSASLYEEKKAVIAALDAYNFFCKQYSGFGFFASLLLWRTEAFLARKILSEKVDGFIEKLIAYEKNNPHPELNADIASLRGPILGLTLMELLKAINEACRPIDKKRIGKNWKDSLARLVSGLPVLCDIYYRDQWRISRLHPDAVARLVHTLFNPVRLVQNFLLFLSRAVSRMIEIGSVDDSESGPVRKFLKGFAGVIFTVINIPVAIVGCVADIPYQALKYFIYSPLKFIVSSLTKKNNDEDRMILKNSDLAVITALKKDAGKHRVMMSSGAPGIGYNDKLKARDFVEREGYDFQDVDITRYDLPAFEYVNGSTLSKEFTLLKPTPASKKVITQLVGIAHHATLLKTEKVDAAVEAIAEAYPVFDPSLFPTLSRIRTQ